MIALLTSHGKVVGGMAASAEWPHLPSVKDRWDVGSLAVSTFMPNLSAKDSVENTWWEWVAEARPGTERVDYQQGTKEQSRTLNGNLLVMTSQPGRVDWTINVATPEPSEPYQIPSLGPMSGDTLKFFIGMTKKWLNVCPTVGRLGFGASLGKLVPSAEDGLMTMQKYLPSIKLGEQSISDFLYRVNRPRNSTSKTDTMINRISAWSVLQFSTGNPMMGSATLSQTTEVPRPYFCRLDLDINTAEFEDAITGDAAYAVFQELVAHGHEIAVKGDIP